MSDIRPFLGAKPDAPTLTVCSYCVKLFPKVDEAMRMAAKDGSVKFNHGSCINHAIEQYKIAGFSSEQIRDIAQRYKAKPNAGPPDLREHPELIELYSQGIFFPQGDQDLALKERLQKLANIIKS